MNSIQSSLRYSAVTYCVVFLLLLVGIYGLFTMPRREDPKITIRTGIVIAFYPGATAEQVEAQVSTRIEERLFRFAEVRKDKTFSTSRTGVSLINVELEDNVSEPDVFWSKLRHDMNLLAATELPAGVRGPMVDSDFGDTVAVLLAIHGEKYDYLELKEYARRIEDEFRTLRAVSKMRRFGEQAEELRITSSLERMSQYSVNPLRVIQALRGRNTVEFAGNLSTGDARVPLQTSGPFQTEQQIRNVMIDISPSGQPVHIGDLAEVTRVNQDPESLVRYNGQRAILLSVEMQEGNNIVEFGEELRTRLALFRTQLPPDLQVELVADQPKVVSERITHFFREFGIAIGSVILVTMLLLPLRVSLIAAIAIPVTVAITFASMNSLGIELHQVSIAALIVVLGMVVDDAIVIADNYVELLDRGVPRHEAAWRSASEMAVPVLTATLTIIASFLPLLLLSGAAGEFISALPYAVAISLGSSYVVAMLLTPLLCRQFIHKGLHGAHSDADKAEQERSTGFSVLDRMQSAYQPVVALAMRWRLTTVTLGVFAVCIGLLLLQFVPEQFFPSAERNQFVVDVWMPEGAPIESTDKTIRVLESLLSADKRVLSYASFVGSSAPRFYYNVNPQPATLNYGQILVNTESDEATTNLVQEFRPRMTRAAPGALVMVKEMQQGKSMEAPIEVRIVGTEIAPLRELASKVEDILRDSAGSLYVHNDYRNDSMQLRVDVKEEVANRIGIANDSIALQLAGAFEGAPVTTYWEGDRAVDVVLRLEESRRHRFENVSGAYIASDFTSARVPLSSIAALNPVWEYSRIVRRNGVRTITVQAFPKYDVWASDLLAEVAPQIQDLALPVAYEVSYGGESENQKETFAEMVRALGVSIVAIFLILLFHFRTITEPLVVMSSIPLALLGAAAGLFVTGNPFGFTAFMGVISLSGIVVRNAIILIDYIKGRIAEGVSIDAAAREAGERRLRPIFLTTMAAAVGVTPMILSGSSLWSPLASVIAVGLIVSMFSTLVVVPVLYVLVERRRVAGEAPSPVSGTTHLPSATAILLFFGLLFYPSSAFGQPRAIGLDEAIAMALRQNVKVRMAELRVAEKGTAIRKARANYFPQVENQSSYLRTAKQQALEFPAGSLGEYPSIGLVPPSLTTFSLGNSNLFLAQTSVKQPLTQIFKIRRAEEAAIEDQQIAESEAARVRSEIAFRVKQVYFSVLIAESQEESYASALSAAEIARKEAEDDVAAGLSLDVSRMQQAVKILEARQGLLSAEQGVSDLRAELNDLLGIALDTPLVLTAPHGAVTSLGASPEALDALVASSPEARAVHHQLKMAEAALGASRAEYIPELGLFAQNVFQSGIPFLPNTNVVYGVQLNWKIFEFGQRRADVSARRLQVEQATQRLREVSNRARLDLEKSARKMERAKSMVELATSAKSLRTELLRIVRDQLEAGLAKPSAVAMAEYELSQADAALLEADLQHRLAVAEFQNIAGQVP